MVTIHEGTAPVTLINVFTVEPDRQREIVGLLEQATEQTIRHLPGFISTSIHASLDGTRIVNYAQWASPENFKGMLGDPDAQKHLQAIMQKVSSSDPQLYSVDKIIGA
jgi:antibiotic biosynthesis monooxygenase (ABM) superfamily enzyme